MTQRSLSAAALAAACLLAAPAAASAWAPGGHAYIALHTGKKGGLTDANERCNRVFGATAVDLFNFDFSPTGFQLQALLHGCGETTVPGNATAAEAWDVATGFEDVSAAELAFAYGFASHNDRWGTDSVAHCASRTLDRAQGYVVQKAAVLAALLPPAAVALVGDRMELVSHVLVEYAMDLVLAGADPTLGLALLQASSLDPELSCEEPAPPRVLLFTLASHVATVVEDEALVDPYILGGEAAVRQVDYAFGWALSATDPAVRRARLAGVIATIAVDFLGPLPEWFPPEQLPVLIAQILEAGEAVVAPDLMDELAATIGRVNGKMSALGISP